MGKCLINYVGIKICQDSVSCDSGIYINTLPGICLEMIEKTATEDQISYAGLWADAQDEAWALFLVDFREAISNCFELSKRCDYEDLICDNKKILVNAWRYLLGAQLLIYRKSSPRLNRFTTIDDDKIDDQIAFYQATYEKILAQAVLLCDLGACRCELVADPKPKSVQWLP